jgi:DNA-directed RNA polymerase subunit RPC12/RpoP
MPTPDIVVAIIISVGLALVFGVWMQYDRADRLFRDHRRLRTVFHCVKCGTLYTRPRRRETGVCPKCGHNNIRLKF